MEFKYILSMCDNGSEDVLEELLSYIDFCYKASNQINEEPIKLSQKALEFLEKTLQLNQTPVMLYLQAVQSSHYYANKSKSTSIDQLLNANIMETFKVKPGHSTDKDKEDLRNIINLLTYLKSFIDKNNKYVKYIIPRLYELIKNGYRKEVYFNLISKENNIIIEALTDYELQCSEQISLNLEPKKMINLCFSFHKHWLMEIISKCENEITTVEKNASFHTTTFAKKIWQLVLINLINFHSEKADISIIIGQLEKVFSLLEYQNSESGLLLYVNEIYRELKLIKFCLDNSDRKIYFGWFEKNQSALSIISQICNLSKLDRFKVKQFLSQNNDYLYKLQNRKSDDNKSRHWDVMTYNAFCIMTSTIDLLLMNLDTATDLSSIAHKIGEIKVMISHLHPLKYRLEILENIFTCLFLRYEYFSNDDNKTDLNITSQSEGSYFECKNINISKRFIESRGFICQPHLVKEILTVIKVSLSEIQNDLTVENKKENDNPKKEEVEDDIKKMENIVTNAMWRWQLISSLNIEDDPKIPKVPSLYDSIIEDSSDEDNSADSVTAVKKKTKSRKVRCKSVNESLIRRPKLVIKNQGRTNIIQGEKPDFISMMLSPPNCLMALCLEAGDFSKAHRIVEMYDLNDTEGSIEVSYTETFLATAAQIRNSIVFSDTKVTRNIHEVEKLTGMFVVSTAVVSLVESFLSTHRPPFDYEISELVHNHPQLQIYDHCNSTLISIIDMVICTGFDRNITYGILNVAEKKYEDLTNKTEFDLNQYNYVLFIRNMINIVYEIYQDTNSFLNNMGMCDILRSDKVPIKYKEFTHQNDYFNTISDFCSETNSNDKFLKDFFKMIDSPENLLFENLINISGKNIFGIRGSDLECRKKSDKTYFNFFNVYLKNVFRLYNIDSPPDDTNREVNILELPLYEIIGKLIFDKNISIQNIEPICQHVGINLIHKLVLNCCPPIKCTPDKNINENERLENTIKAVMTYDDSLSENLIMENSADVENVYRKPNKQIITYVLIHNWVIANLVKKVHLDSKDYALKQSFDARTKCLDNYLQEDRFNTLKDLYFNNKPIAALQTCYDLDNICSHIERLLLNKQIIPCFKILDSLPENQLFPNSHLMKLRDNILLKISTAGVDNWMYFLWIESTDLQADYILQNMVTWSCEGATEVLQYFCHNKDNVRKAGVAEECNQWLTRLPIYQKITEFCPGNTWSQIFSLSNDDPEYIIQKLMDAQQFELCLNWAQLHNVSSNIKSLITYSHLKQLLTAPNDKPFIYFDDYNTLLSDIPMQQAISLCDEMLDTIRDLSILKKVIEFLISNSCDTTKYENMQIGIELLTEISEKERSFFWEIRNKPLLIIEQYLMNAKLDKLAKLLKKIKPLLVTDIAGDNLYYNISLINTVKVSINSVDALLRIYALKSLDLKSAKILRENQLSNRPEEMFSQSIDSINLVGDKTAFIMPEEVPAKEGWVPDNHTDRCMSCKTTIFSILIRRHHCRRCGRLVCYYCSRNKLKIEDLYDDIKVRVCNDCYQQTVKKTTKTDVNPQSSIQISSGSTNSDTISMEWCLTANPKHNEELRKEFVYEFSPNVNLCLTIMKMHSINLDYPRFLLDRSKELATAASTVGGNGAGGGSVQELLRMRRALLLWCVVLYARPPPAAPAALADTALAHTERQLAITDTLALLAVHGCHSMMPKNDVLDTHCVRHLLEAEKWELALDVSTKFGMSRTGVFAAWGKACLKAGCYMEARKKFSLCFKTISTQSTQPTDEFDVSKEMVHNKVIQRLKKSESSPFGSQQDLSRIRNNPALLKDIISLLENISYPVNTQLLKKAESLKSTMEKISTLHKPAKKVNTIEPTLNIMHALASLNKIKQGDYSDYYTTSYYAKKPKPTSMLKKQNVSNDKFDFKPKLEPFFYDECMYYLNSYGSHNSIIEFYLKYNDIQDALKYCCNQSVEREVFTESLFMTFLKSEKIDCLLKAMYEMDNTWGIWTEYLMYVCRVLEQRGWLEKLLLVQAGVGDHVRAAMTCVGLYKLPTNPPHAKALHTRAHHLTEARGHLQNVPRKRYEPDSRSNEPPKLVLHLKMDSASLDKHINTICRQLVIAQFLYACEKAGRLKDSLVNKTIPSLTPNEDLQRNDCFLPTLFGSNSQKIKLAALVMVAAANITDGFPISLEIIKDHSLDATKVFSYVARYLIKRDRYEELISLCERIKIKCEENSSIIENFIEVSVMAIVRQCDSKEQLFDELAEVIIQNTENISVKISCYIECRNLKTAYDLAVGNKRIGDLKRIMREAERLGQTQVRNSCFKQLQRKNP